MTLNQEYTRSKIAINSYFDFSLIPVLVSRLPKNTLTGAGCMIKYKIAVGHLHEYPGADKTRVGHVLC